MESFNHHPLDFIYNQSNLSMLESLIPFLDYPMKLPIALLIKFQEIQFMIHLFQFPKNLSHYGLHNTNNDPTYILSTLLGIPQELLKTMMNFSETFSSEYNFNENNPNDYSKMANLFANFSKFQEDNLNSNNNENSENDDFNLNFQKILAEYDLTQAENYQKDNLNTSLNTN